MDSLAEHAAVSRRFGADAEMVFLGGGNTSFKTDETLYIKPSGVALATIAADEFVAVDRAALRRVFTESLPTDVPAREAAVKELMLAAVCGEQGGRPSVETPVHEVIAFPYVYHMHPALVNGLTCARAGAEAAAELFPTAVWLDYVDPGHTLANAVRQRVEALAASGRRAQVLFLQNHGVFVGADSLAEIVQLYEGLLATLRGAYERAAVALDLPTAEPDAGIVREHAPRLRVLLGADSGRGTVCATAGFAPASGPFTPDHVVYARSYAYAGELSEAGLAAFRERRGYMPRVVAGPGGVVFCAGATLKEAREVRVAARDAARVEALTAAFGGPHYLSAAQHAFIEGWEVESYRRRVGAGAAAPGRLQQRVCLVTGGAQGFGLGIAEGLVREGGTVVLADINLEGAREAAEQLNRRFGAHRAIAVSVDIADEASVAEMVDALLRECGGVDLLVANAGVLRAGSVKELSLRDWQFVTSVNYTGYFLCVKHVAPVMAAQALRDDGRWTDIIQVNSKSGLEGSNRNAAYAGSKFGGLGLTQSFAKELVVDRIKVNSICPGNYLDGPLWSDPDRGLFVQYLRTGKVPGAKTLDDVRRAYEAKVPMGRGCRPEDVVCAILYLVEQVYETGQALPVTGGQVMLK